MTYEPSQKLFSMRIKSEEDDRFLAIIDDLRTQQQPEISRTAMIKKLAFDAARKGAKRK